MRFLKLFFAAILTSVHIGLVSCVKFEIDDHSYQFNEATGSLGLRLLLLNAVRASKDYPLQFSKISAYQGSGAIGGSVSANIPFKPFPTNAFGTVGPKLDWKDGVTQLNLVDLNTEEAQQALKKVVDYGLFRYYAKYRGGRSIGVVNSIMIEGAAMPRILHTLIRETVSEQCASYKGTSQRPSHLDQTQFSRLKYVCSILESFEKHCPDLYNPTRIPGDGILLQSDLSSECKHRQFLAGGLQFFVLGVSVVELPKSNETGGPNSTKVAGGNTFNIYVAESKGEEKTAGRERYGGMVGDTLFLRKCRERAPKLCSPKSDSIAIPVAFHFRSPERMVRYLGELVAAQNYGARRFVPYTVDPETQEVLTLLRVVRGSPPPGVAAVTVQDPEGETFYVPKPDYNSTARDRSLEVLSIVSDVLNGAVSRKAFPQPTTFTLAPSP